jgi:hypothetical protein
MIAPMNDQENILAELLRLVNEQVEALRGRFLSDQDVEFIRRKLRIQELLEQARHGAK